MKQSSVNFQHESILIRRLYSTVANNKNKIDICIFSVFLVALF